MDLQKEQERERRRLRDRQRRQAMSVEEREKHLARRRRNYQLRRQRARNVRDPQLSQASLVDSDEMLMLPSNGNNQAVISVPAQSNGISDVDWDQRQGRVNVGNANSVAGLEIPAHKLAKLPIRSRLNHIKHLARSLADTLDIGDSHKITADLTMTGDATFNCTPPKPLRLNRVKHLARVLSSDVTPTTVPDRNGETKVEQNLSSGEHLMSINLPKVVQTINFSGGDE
ncbi:PREDICTED: uncharacterized protein LOC105136509 isoform X1 [Populus euphratica]|uniref:Uncharacterized protein LOC105136509 isoform X1 n=1 Tax=Populus euphratica TaxID=75702 RepID=A0AAJ6Y2S9_POPEU|nr:PREDICTED: uncharacterized protein LOC105136509 isoform X1 [Populus euphratica]XP_011040191.1 PREDICTED: uncharacterized protein LOC105136509 isoform X1 [Populus euphratica]XP_011040192.1 PREDICTED: uncharacterized protein LOC105136509 isoform X1 [Populus euphratica]XP_011040193.1 PREDICTED: uncharacterized protein LOC105136509 isoform X1 [Populus euphratica]XP_011040194.1 PREDICTED: uncharacterized protein LOC105136509 isoform X1 [Populus euphratica]XP_011040195.1 PREDICTED: uncharacterize